VCVHTHTHIDVVSKRLHTKICKYIQLMLVRYFKVCSLSLFFHAAIIYNSIHI